MRRQLSVLGKKIDHVLQPVFTSRKISEDLKVTETKPLLANQQCDSCDANYIDYTLSRHLHLRIEGRKYSVAGRHLKDKHNQTSNNHHEQFTTLTKCRRKFECLIYKMLFMRKKSDSEYSKRLHSSENFYLHFPHSFVYLLLIYSNVLSHIIFLT